MCDELGDTGGADVDISSDVSFDDVDSSFDDADVDVDDVDEDVDYDDGNDVQDDVYDEDFDEDVDLAGVEDLSAEDADAYDEGFAEDVEADEMRAEAEPDGIDEDEFDGNGVSDLDEDADAEIDDVGDVDDKQGDLPENYDEDLSDISDNHDERGTEKTESPEVEVPADWDEDLDTEEGDVPANVLDENTDDGSSDAPDVVGSEMVVTDEEALGDGAEADAVDLYSTSHEQSETHDNDEEASIELGEGSSDWMADQDDVASGTDDTNPAVQEASDFDDESVSDMIGASDEAESETVETGGSEAEALDESQDGIKNNEDAVASQEVDDGPPRDTSADIGSGEASNDLDDQTYERQPSDAEDTGLAEDDALSQLTDYMNDHNYGADDYSEYSQDPEWQRLHDAAFPDGLKNQASDVDTGEIYEHAADSDDYIGSRTAVEEADLQGDPVDVGVMDPLDYPRRDDVGSIDDALDAINRDYDSRSDDVHSNNCWSCSDAYELQRRGYDMDAIPSWGTSMNDIAQDWQRQVSPFDTRAMEIMDTNGSGYDDICTAMMEYGDGARAQVLVTWADAHGNPSGGHAFVCEQENGRTRFLDPQSHNRDVHTYFDYVVPNTTKFFRTDDVPLSSHALSGCVRPIRK